MSSPIAPLQLRIVNLSIALFGLGHLYAAFNPSVLNWGLHPLAFGPAWARWAVPLLMLLLAFPAFRQTGVRAVRNAADGYLSLSRVARLAAMGVGLAMAGGAFHLLGSAGIGGDGQFLIHNMGQIARPTDIAHVYIHEPLTCLINWAVARAMSARIGDAEAQAAYGIVSVASGVAFLPVLWALCRRLIRGRTDRILAFLFVLGSGSTLLFFAHVENYTVAFTVLALYALAVLRYCDGASTLVAPSVAAGALIPLYFGMLCVLPSLALLYAGEFRRTRSVRALLLPAAAFAATFFGLLLPTGFTPERFATLLSGGAGHLVGVFEPTGPMVGYTLFSTFHLADLANLALFLSPFSIVFLLLRRPGTPAGPIKVERSAAVGRHPAFAPLMVLAAAGAVVAATFRCDLAMPRDWDLLSPLALGGILLSVVVVGRRIPESDARSSMLFGASAVMLLRIGPWAWLNHAPDPAIAQNRMVLVESTWITDLHKGWEPLAMVARRAGNTDSALAWYRSFLAGDPNHPRILGNVADIYRVLGVEDSEMVYDERAVQNGSTVPAVHFNLGTIYAGRGRYEDAADAMMGGLALEPGRADIVNAVGSFMLRAGGDCRDAMPLFLDAIRIDKGYALAWLNAADCSGASGDTAAMRRYLERVVALDPALARRFDVHGRLASLQAAGDAARPPPR